MDDTPCRRFFLEPGSAPQRQYEALRAVFVEGDRQKDVAQRFGYDYGAFRQLVCQFRAGCGGGQPPPFFKPHARDGHRGRRRRGRSARPRRTVVASA
jgi:hypothetical protein